MDYGGDRELVYCNCLTLTWSWPASSGLYLSLSSWMFPQLNVPLFLAVLFIASCAHEHSSSCGKLRNICSHCGVGQGEGRFVAVLEIQLWMMIKATWILSLAKRAYLVSCFSFQRLINEPEGCVEGRLTKPYPQGARSCSTVPYSSACGKPNS